ncbi:MAG: glycosyltransferase family 4 protein [Nitrososphaerota archaeon]|nr:glycosyltransferase family 4 protein [Nitrososphaerota archaeon]
MRIAIIDDAGFGSGKPGLFGKELYSELLAQLNEEILRNEVFRISLGGLVDDGKSIAVIGSKRPIFRTLYDEVLISKLASVLQKSSVDLIHVNILNARYPRSIVRLARKIGKPIVCTVHNWTYVCPTGWAVKFPDIRLCKPGLHFACVRTLWNLAKINNRGRINSISNGVNQYFSLRHLIKNSAAVVSPSEQLAKAIRENMGLNNVFTIPNPVAKSLLELKPQFGGEASVVFCGRLTFEKGVHLVPSIAERNPNIAHHVIGSGPLAEVIMKACSSHKNIIYHGFVSDERKFEIIRKCSSVLMPTLWRETFGYTTAEAFALGKPVVGFALGGVQELVESSGCGYAARLNDIDDIVEKIRKTVCEQDKSVEQGKLGRKYVESKLTMGAYAESLDSIYKTATSTQSARIRAR